MQREQEEQAVQAARAGSGQLAPWHQGSTRGSVQTCKGGLGSPIPATSRRTKSDGGIRVSGRQPMHQSEDGGLAPACEAGFGGGGT